jgi:hypothetical protein
MSLPSREGYMSPWRGGTCAAKKQQRYSYCNQCQCSNSNQAMMIMMMKQGEIPTGWPPSEVAGHAAPSSDG